MQKKRTAFALALTLSLLLLFSSFPVSAYNFIDDPPTLAAWIMDTLGLGDSTDYSAVSSVSIIDLSYGCYARKWKLSSESITALLKEAEKYTVDSKGYNCAQEYPENTLYPFKKMGKYSIDFWAEKADDTEKDGYAPLVLTQKGGIVTAPLSFLASRPHATEHPDFHVDESFVAFLDTFLNENTEGFSPGYSSWATEPIRRALSEEWIPYHRDEPTNILYRDFWEDATRKEFCILAYGFLVKIGKINPDTVYENPFTDESDHSVAALSTLGIIKGTSDTTFSPYETITREEAATILDRLDTFLNEKQNGETAAPDELYADDAALSDWARESVYRMREEKILIGKDGGNFAPRDNFTLEQSITALLRLYDAARSGTNA